MRSGLLPLINEIAKKDCERVDEDPILCSKPSGRPTLIALHRLQASASATGADRKDDETAEDDSEQRSQADECRSLSSRQRHHSAGAVDTYQRSDDARRDCQDSEHAKQFRCAGDWSHQNKDDSDADSKSRCNVKPNGCRGVIRGAQQRGRRDNADHSDNNHEQTDQSCEKSHRCDPAELYGKGGMIPHADVSNDVRPTVAAELQRMRPLNGR
jgi:hypothetical protein